VCRKALTTVIDSDYLGTPPVDVTWRERHGEGSQRLEGRDCVWLSGKCRVRGLPGDQRQVREIVDRSIELGSAGEKGTWLGGLPLQSRALWHSW
jgi:hypothetical protein